MLLLFERATSTALSCMYSLKCVVMKMWNLFQKKERKEMHRIFSCSIHDDVEILGHVFHGLKDIQAYVEMTKYDGGVSDSYAREPEKKGTVHVGELWMRYPCFDSSDFLYENRSYQNFILRDRPITSSDMKRLEKLPTHMNAKRLDASVPEEMLPMVYYVGEGNTMLVAV